MSENIGGLWVFHEQWRFKEIPSEMDFGVYMKALLICANGDGILTQEERDWVIGYSSALGAPDMMIEQLKGYEADEDINDIISDSQVVGEEGPKRSLIFDAIRACSADGDYHEDEKAVIHQMAARLGVSETVVNQIEEMYVEELKVTENRIRLIFPHGRPF